MLHAFASSLVALFRANPLAFIIAGVGLWVLGWARRSARRPKGNMLLGLLEVLALAGWIHKNRHNVTRAVAWSVLTLTVAGWALAIWLRPELGLRLILPATVAALVYGAWWVDHTVGDTPLRKVIADWVDGKSVRNAAALTPEVRVGPARALPAGGWEASVHVADGTDLDGQAVAARAVARGIPVRSVEVLPGDQLGNALVRLSPDPPEPDDPWHGLDRIVPWPGPSTTDPDSPIPIGFDRRGKTLTIPGPNPSDVEHAGLAGATRRGKSAMLVAIVAELAYRENLALVLLDPAEVEFAPWMPRASKIYTGTEACQQGVHELLKIMERRKARVRELGRHTAPLGPHWPRVVVVVDEVAAMIEKAKDVTSNGLAQLSEQAGKFGIQLVVATQRPEVGVWEGRLRDNLLARVGFKHSSGEASRMTAGKEGPDLTTIPKRIQGAFMVHHDMEWTCGRGFLVQPRRPVLDDEKSEALIYAAEEIAEATAHLRIPWEEL